MKRNYKYVALLVVLPILSSCSLFGAPSSSAAPATSLQFKSIAAKGHTSLSLASFFNNPNDNITLTDSSSAITQAFSSTDYEVIIADTYTGLDLIQNHSAKFKLARVLVTGNLYLVSTGKDSDNTPTDDDYIVSFKEGSYTDKVAKLSSGLTPDSYVPNEDDLETILAEGNSGANEVDYVIMSQPHIQNVIEKTDKKTTPVIVKDLSSTVGNYKGFPQEALFVSEAVENDSEKLVKLNNLLITLDCTQADLATNGATTTINQLKQLGNQAAQQTFCGIDSQELELLQFNSSSKRSQNQLGYNYQVFNVESFAKDNTSLDLLEVKKDSLSAFFPAN